MKWMSLKGLMRISVAVALLAMGSLVRAEDRDSSKITELFGEIKRHAVQAERDADHLEAYSRGNSLSWGTHAHRVNRMKDHVNALLKDFDTAQKLRDEGSPWQREAIDQLEPLLKGMADHLSATIEHANENQARVKMGPWKELTRTNRDYAFKAANLIRDVVDYSESKAKLETLEKKLEMPATNGEG